MNKTLLFQCPYCQSKSPEGSRFCKTCGKTLVRDCPICLTESYIVYDFCSSCGRAFEEIEKSIAFAKNKKGGQTQMLYEFTSVTQDDKISEPLAPDEYIIKDEMAMMNYLDDKKKDLIDSGHLWLTNRRLVYLGQLWEDNLGWNWSTLLLPLDNIKRAEVVSKRSLLFINIAKLLITTNDDDQFQFDCKTQDHWVKMIKTHINRK